VILTFSEISSNYFFIEKIIDRVYESWDHVWLSVHGGLSTMERRGHSRALEVVVIAWREREEIVEVLTNDATWRRSCGDGHTIALNRGG
jgi:hypothetical protein